jgi:hypothetical protein
MAGESDDERHRQNLWRVKLLPVALSRELFQGLRELCNVHRIGIELAGMPLSATSHVRPRIGDSVDSGDKRSHANSFAHDPTNTLFAISALVFELVPVFGRAR